MQVRCTTASASHAEMLSSFADTALGSPPRPPCALRAEAQPDPLELSLDPSQGLSAAIRASRAIFPGGEERDGGGRKHSSPTLEGEAEEQAHGHPRARRSLYSPNLKRALSNERLGEEGWGKGGEGAARALFAGSRAALGLAELDQVR